MPIAVPDTERRWKICRVFHMGRKQTSRGRSICQYRLLWRSR